MNNPSPPRTVGQNLRLLLPVALFQTVVYVTLNQLRWLSPRALPVTRVDDWFPFWPWTVVPYMLFFLLAFPVALLIRSEWVVYRAVRAYFLCLAMTVPFFLFWPTLCPRPDLSEVEDSWDVTAYRWLTEVDTAACSFPSLHIILPAIICWMVFADGRWWAGWFTCGMLLLSLTILTTKQHYAWDWLGGMVIAVLGLWLSGRWPFAKSQ